MNHDYLAGIEEAKFVCVNSHIITALKYVDVYVTVQMIAELLNALVSSSKTLFISSHVFPRTDMTRETKG